MNKSPAKGGEPLLAEEAYKRIRSAIVEGEYRPREPLIEADLAEHLEIGRTPVRESMQRLAAEGLVVRRRRGWAVHEHSSEEIRELYELRAGLEGFAARLVAGRAAQAEIEAIEATGAGDLAVVSAPRARLVEVNDAFHAALGAASGNRKLVEAIHLSHEHFFNFRVMSLFSDKEAEHAVVGHRETIDALLARDADAADRSARQHVLDAVEVVLAKVKF